MSLSLSFPDRRENQPPLEDSLSFAPDGGGAGDIIEEDDSGPSGGRRADDDDAETGTDEAVVAVARDDIGWDGGGGRDPRF